MPMPTFREALEKLVAIPSVSSADLRFDQGNRAVIEQLATWLEGAGFSCQTIAVSEDGQKLDLVASLGTGEDGLVLAGHTDTVPWDAGRWTSDPFALTERDDRLYGLGTSDMKGFFAIVLEALSELSLGKLVRPLIVVATADEESTMEGAKALVRAKTPRAKYCVVGEPTNLRPMRMHKGVSLQTLKIIGQSGHSSDPALGKNALEAMADVVQTLRGYREELVRKHHHVAFHPPYPTLNLGAIHGGDSANRICGECELAFDFRPTPGIELARVREELSVRIGKTLEGRGFSFALDFGTAIAPFEQQAGSRLVRETETLTGVAAGAVAFGTEAPYFQELGAETVVLGPGDIAQAHQPDEYFPCETIEPARKLIRDLVGKLCTET